MFIRYRTTLIIALCIIVLPLLHSMHLGIPEEHLGIAGLFNFSPKTAKPMRILAERLLYDDDNSLSRGERELIAAYVSYLNDCYFCCTSHSAIAVCMLPEGNALLEAVKKDPETAPISEKMKALLALAAAVQQSGKAVTEEMLVRARNAGVTDQELHDTVLIAAAFCMFNRYVDGLAAWTPTDPAIYAAIGDYIATHGYMTHDKWYRSY